MKLQPVLPAAEVQEVAYKPVLPALRVVAEAPVVQALLREQMPGQEDHTCACAPCHQWLVY